MKIVFITYGNSTYEKSKQRIIKEAQNLNLFNQIIAYGPDNLSNEIKLSPLFQYKKGGGYWIWKSYIIKETLKKWMKVIFYFMQMQGVVFFLVNNGKNIFHI